MRRLALALLMVGAAVPALARDISGSVTYLPRIALSPAAELVVEISGPAGVTGEFRAPSDGQQVPLSFTVTSPDTGAQFLQAAILVAGVPQWVTPPIAVAAGDAAQDLGMITLEPFVPLGFVSRLRCGETVVDLGFMDDEARLRVGGVVHRLPAAISASGARFSDGKDPETMVWTKANMALVTIAGQELPECQAVAMPATLPFIARGNEPGWALHLATSGMTLAMQDGSEIRTPLPPADTGPAGTILATDALTVTITPQICRDSMSGMPYPQAVRITTPEAELHGCGGDPATLLAGNWQVRTMNGSTLPDTGSDTGPNTAGLTMRFAMGGVSGSTGCNRFRAGVTLTGEGLTITPGPLTMMACDETTMAREREFLDLLDAVTGFDFDQATGALILTAGGQPVLTAAPAL